AQTTGVGVLERGDPPVVAVFARPCWLAPVAAARPELMLERFVARTVSCRRRNRRRRSGRPGTARGRRLPARRCRGAAVRARAGPRPLGTAPGHRDPARPSCPTPTQLRQDHAVGSDNGFEDDVLAVLRRLRPGDLVTY